MSKSILKLFRKLNKGPFLKYLAAFILINICLFFFVNRFNNLVSFNRDYYNAAVHFYEDPRITNKKFDFFKSSSVYDSQWYLEIARSGYPKININSKSIDLLNNDLHKYAFFPFYPLLLALINIPINNLELTALYLSAVFMIIDFYLLYLFISLIDTKKTAIKTAFLLFVYPLSIFYRSIFSEGLFLALLLLFTIFLFKKRFYLSALFLGLSLITRANAFPFVLLLFFDFYQSNKNLLNKEKIIKFIKLIFIISFPLFMWLLFNYYQTNNLFAFLKVRDYLVKNSLFSSLITIINPLLNNLYRIIEFPFLPWHAFADSKIEVISVIIIFYLLIKSKKYLDYRLWWIAFGFWIFPLVTTSLISYSRYQVVSFPIFYYLAKRLNNWQYTGVFLTFIIGLFVLSLYFVNWYWFG